MNAAKTETLSQPQWHDVCALSDLVPCSGVAALVQGKQLALFYLPGSQPAVFALDNWCPAAEANVLSRGIVGSLNGETVVASPIYKEHFSLTTGQCQEKPLAVKTWPVKVDNNHVMVMV